jgi:hypothetical protein
MLEEEAPWGPLPVLGDMLEYEALRGPLPVLGDMLEYEALRGPLHPLPRELILPVAVGVVRPRHVQPRTGGLTATRAWRKHRQVTLTHRGHRLQ